MTSGDTKSALAAAWVEARASSGVLQEQIDRYVAASRRIIPDVLMTYDRMVERLMVSDAGSTAPAVGDTLPDGMLPDDLGRLVRISQLYAQRPLVVSFNRGHWCPYCRLELQALKQATLAIESTGGALVSVVPEIGAYRAKMIEDNGLAFRVMSDIDLAYAMELGLVVWIGEDMKALYQARGIDLARFQDNDAWMLPIPATFVVAHGGRIAARFVDPEFRRRMPIEDILSGLRSLQG